MYFSCQNGLKTASVIAYSAGNGVKRKKPVQNGTALANVVQGYFSVMVTKVGNCGTSSDRAAFFDGGRGSERRGCG
ncbi:hypothetical protein AV903_10590 [Erwinia tracheiphila]|uniref:Uncharacterized protein n=1 Tax=Erwinia tracheiphila TaxID=65700 RepID=A0A345CSI2_9GAMM|nr:hypothetical protein AV903_10590 [Erwinia tracheiphila]